MAFNSLFLGVDGGGTGCRARLCDAAGHPLGEGRAGPANIRLGVEPAFRAVLDATLRCLEQAQLTPRDLPRITACLALAGATEPAELQAAQRQKHAFGKVILTSDAHAACLGAHNGADGGIVVVGTGSIGWAVLHGRTHRIGGWGPQLSDEGSGAWIGREALRLTLMAQDGRIGWSAFLRHVLARHDGDPHAIVRFAAQAAPGDLAALAPAAVEHAQRNDDAATSILRRAAGHIDAIALRLIALGVTRLSLTGGLAPHIAPLLAPATRGHLTAPLGDAVAGALLLARAAARAAAA